MALLFASASSQHIEATTAAVTVKPLTLACWYNPTTFAGQQAMLMSLMTAGTANRHFGIAVQTSGNPIVIERGSTSASNAVHTGAVTNGQWGHIGGTFASGATGARIPYFNGVAATGNTTSSTAPVPDRTSIAAYNVSVAATPGSFADGAIAEAGIWNVVLTADEMAMLAHGVRPFQVRPSALVFYAPLRSGASPEIDIRGSLSLVWTGTPTLASHPPILGQAGKLWVPPIGAAANPLTGTIAATSTLTGAATDTAALAGTITATSAVTGALTDTDALAGTISATSTLTGSLTNTGPIHLAGTIASTSTLTGTPTVSRPLTGTIAATSTLTGDATLTTIVELAGEMDIASTLTASLTVLEPPAPSTPSTTRYAIHWFWEPGNQADDTQPPIPDTCPECGSKVVLMGRDGEVITRHYAQGATKTDGTTADTDCPYIATINTSNYAQPLPADITAGYVIA